MNYNFLWDILIIFLIAFSLYVSYKIKFKNYNILYILKSFKSESLLGLFLTLSTKIGVGSIIGTTAAIFVGGPGSLFWLWIFSFITSSLVYLEIKIGGKYKEKNLSGYVSGPFFIIKNGLNKKSLALLTGLILIITYSFLFLMVQTNTINSIILLNFNISKKTIFLILLIFLLFTTIFNQKELLNITKYLVPIMCLFFIIISIFVLLKNSNMLIDILKKIIKSAFNGKSFFTGMLIGIRRSIFLNELLIGTTSSTGLVDSNNDEKCALIEVFGSYFITFVIGTLNAFMVLIFLNNNVVNFLDYNELINNVFIYHFNFYGPLILTIILLLFAITTIISGIYIGLSNLKNMVKNKCFALIFKILLIFFCMLGLFINVDFMWELIDLFLLILLFINGTVLFIIIKRGKYDWK